MRADRRPPGSRVDSPPARPALLPRAPGPARGPGPARPAGPLRGKRAQQGPAEGGRVGEARAQQGRDGAGRKRDGAGPGQARCMAGGRSRRPHRRRRDGGPGAVLRLAIRARGTQPAGAPAARAGPPSQPSTRSRPHGRAGGRPGSRVAGRRRRARADAGWGVTGGAEPRLLPSQVPGRAGRARGGGLRRCARSARGVACGAEGARRRAGPKDCAQLRAGQKLPLNECTQRMSGPAAPGRAVESQITAFDQASFREPSNVKEHTSNLATCIHRLCPGRVWCAYLLNARPDVSELRPGSEEGENIGQS